MLKDLNHFKRLTSFNQLKFMEMSCGYSFGICFFPYKTKFMVFCFGQHSSIYLPELSQWEEVFLKNSEQRRGRETEFRHGREETVARARAVIHPRTTKVEKWRAFPVHKGCGGAPKSY